MTSRLLPWLGAALALLMPLRAAAAEASDLGHQLPLWSV